MNDNINSNGNGRMRAIADSVMLRLAARTIAIVAGGIAIPMLIYAASTLNKLDKSYAVMSSEFATLARDLSNFRVEAIDRSATKLSIEASRADWARQDGRDNLQESILNRHDDRIQGLEELLRNQPPPINR